MPVRTPFNPSMSLKKNNGPSVSQIEYAKIIGSVMFLMNYTRPNIAYAVSRLSRYTHNPNDKNWNACIYYFHISKVLQTSVYILENFLQC